MGFDPCNCFLKIWDSIRMLTPKVGVHLGVWRFIPSHSPTLPGVWDVTHGLPSWPAPLQTPTLVTSPRLGLQHHRCIILLWLDFRGDFQVKVSACRNPTLAKCGGEAQHFQSWVFKVLRDSRMFRVRQQGPKHLALRCSWCHWKGLEA
jgi:hypothetical protein